jgi:lipid A oxidase
MRPSALTTVLPRCRAFLAGLLVLAVGFAVGVLPAKAEVELSIFTGVALSQDSDLDLHQRGGTDLTFHDVSFEGRDFSTPPYYGIRALWFPSQTSHWGFGAEFFHMKMYAQTDDTVNVTGRRDGVGVNGSERISDTIDSFSLSHGLNYALGDIVYRWMPGKRGEDFLGHLEPYAGIGLGLTVPHVESSVNGNFHEEYQVHGPGVQALAGVNVLLTRHIGLMFEYKFTYSNLDSLDIPGGSIEVTPLTHHLVTGLTFSF